MDESSAAMEVNVPPYFLCPISLQIMRDPVTLPTGITYDRRSIEHWISSAKSTTTCPVTRQPLKDPHLTPNSTLCRLIQSWCSASSALPGIERFPTPRAPLGKPDIARLLDKLREPNSTLDSLRRLRDIVEESDRCGRLAEEAGAAHVLVDLIDKSSTVNADEAISVLYHIRLTDDGLRDLVVKNANVVETLTAVLKSSGEQSRTYAVSLARSIFQAVSPVRLAAVKREFYGEVVRVLKDRVSQKATRSAMGLLRELLPWGRNRVRATEAGAVQAIVDLLLESPEGRRTWEMGMVVLELLCGCAEGRQALAGHAAGMAVVSKAVLGVSAVASEKAVKVLYLVAKHAAGRGAVVKEMAEVGAVGRVCMAMQVEGGVGIGGRTKERVVEMLRLHSNVWKRSPCIDPVLLSSLI